LQKELENNVQKADEIPQKTKKEMTLKIRLHPKK
jgi:hypothetical protein